MEKIKSKFQGPFPIFPLFIALYPSLALAAANLSQVAVFEWWRVYAVCFALGLALWLLLRVFVWSWKRAALLAALILILFFSFGHIHGLTSVESDSTVWLGGVWIALLIGGTWWMFRQKAQLASITRILNGVSLVLLLFPLLSVGSFYLQSSPKPLQNTPDFDAMAEETGFQQEESQEQLPDIYYIIMDGYARVDVLADVYKYDNRPVLDHLWEMGFYVAEESFANYNQTFLSVPSSMNMAYFPDLMVYEPDSKYDHTKHVNLVRYGAVFKLAHKLGYKIVSFSSGHGLTELSYVDIHIDPEGEAEALTGFGVTVFDYSINLAPFETLFLETTALRPFLPAIYNVVEEPPKFQLHRQRVLNAFEKIPSFAIKSGNYFVFAHIISPHPPFVFEADGSPRISMKPYTIADGTHFVGNKGTREEYITGYHNQLTYVNTLLIAMIQEILAKSVTPPIIIIQADHGPGSHFDWHSIENTNLFERMGIMNAYYFPDENYDLLYPSITPVNSFRVIFSQYFDQEYELLEDVSYFSDGYTPYDFIDINDLLGVE